MIGIVPVQRVINYLIMSQVAFGQAVDRHGAPSGSTVARVYRT